MEEKTKQKIQKFLALFSISVSDTAAENILQFIKFGIVGATNTAISYLLNIAVLFLMRPLNAACCGVYAAAHERDIDLFHAV